MAVKRHFRFKKHISVGRVVTKLIGTILALYIGGTILGVFESVMENKSSAFFEGLELIGWTVDANGTITSSVNQSSNGVLVVIGLIALGSIVTEFVDIRL